MSKGLARLFVHRQSVRNMGNSYRVGYRLPHPCLVCSMLAAVVFQRYLGIWQYLFFIPRFCQQAVRETALIVAPVCFPYAQSCLMSHHSCDTRPITVMSPAIPATAPQAAPLPGLRAALQVQGAQGAVHAPARLAVALGPAAAVRQ